MGDWKLIYELDREQSDKKARRRIYRPALYDLKNDPLEKQDVINQYPEKASTMQALIQQAQKPLP